MKEHKKTEEQQKDLIFDTFSKCRIETASVRLKDYFEKLYKQIYFWYKDYLNIDVSKIDLEIAEVIHRFIEDDKISKIPGSKDGFFRYLNTSIRNEKAVFKYKYNDEDTIQIPKEKKRKLREVEDTIRMKESDLGRKLSPDEKVQCISKWFKKQEYIDLLNAANVGSISIVGDDENSEIDALNLKAAPVYNTHISNDPLDEYIQKTSMETVLEAVKLLIDKKQERSRDCYRALFTLHCIENYKNFEMLYPVLDGQILDTWQKEKKTPNQYEIYQKFHPNSQKPSAEAMASTNLKEFLKDVEIYLKENI